MPHSLQFYLQRRDEALKQAEDNPLSGEEWLRLASEWQKIHDAVASMADQSPDQGSPPA